MDNASIVQLFGTSISVVTMVVGIGVLWGRQEQFTKALDERIVTMREDKIHEHDQMRAELHDHEQRIGKLEGKGRWDISVPPAG